MAPVKATLWSFLSVATGAVLQLALLLYLARTLPEAQLGLIFISLAFIYISQMLQDSGLTVLLLQRRQLTRSFWHICRWQALAQGAAVAMLLGLMAPLAGSLYDSPALTAQVVVIAVLQLVNALALCGQAMMIRQQQLTVLAKFEIVAKLAGAALVWPGLSGSSFDMQLVIWGFVLAALVKAILIRGLVNCWPAQPPVRWSRTKRIWQHSFLLNLTQLAALLRSQFDTFIVGKWFGLDVLALYGLAREIIQGPLKILQPLLQRLLQAKWSGLNQVATPCLLPDLHKTLFSTVMTYCTLLLLLPAAQQLLQISQDPHFLWLLLTLALFGAIRPLGQVGVLYAELNNQLAKLLRWAWLSTVLWCSVLTLAAMLLGSNDLPVLWFAVVLCLLQLGTTLLSLYYFAGLHLRQLPAIYGAVPVVLAAAAWLGDCIASLILR